MKFLLVFIIPILCGLAALWLGVSNGSIQIDPSIGKILLGLILLAIIGSVVGSMMGKDTRYESNDLATEIQKKSNNVSIHNAEDGAVLVNHDSGKSVLIREEGDSISIHSIANGHVSKRPLIVNRRQAAHYITRKLTE